MEEGGAEWKRKFVELFQVSQQHLEEGTFVFRKIKDNVNVALLSCDLAKLHWLQARTLALTEKKEASLAEWKCYSKVWDDNSCHFMHSFNSLFFSHLIGITMLQTSVGHLGAPRTEHWNLWRYCLGLHKRSLQLSPLCYKTLHRLVLK